MSGTNSSTDAAIPLQAGQGVQQPQNPLQTIGQFAETRALLNQNALFPGAQQLQQQQIQSGQTNLLNLNNQAVYRNLAPLLASGQPITHDSLTTALAGLERAGYSTHGVISDILGGAPMPDGPGFNGNMRALIASRAQSSPESAVSMVTPQAGPIMSNGQSLQPTTVSPMGSATPGVISPAGTPTQVYPSRSELLTQQPGIGPNGAPTVTPLIDRANTQGAGALTGPAGAGVASSQMPPPSPANPPRLFAAAQPPAPGGAVTVGLSPAAAAAAPQAGAANAQQAVGLQQAAGGVPAQKALLGNLQAALGQFTAGGGADWKNVAKTFVNANNPFGNIFDPSKIASQDEFGKMAFQLAQQQFQTLGGTGTDAKLNSTMHTSPSTFLSNQSNENIINLLKGNADAISAMNNAWQNQWLPAHGGDTSTYAQFQGQFNKNFDPRVFQSAYMTPQQRSQILSGMSPAEATAFRQKYNMAVASGMIPDPRSAQPSQAAPTQTANAAPAVPTN